MVVLTIGSDRNLFHPSPVRERIKAYGGLFDRLEIIVFARRGLAETEISRNVRVHPTNSRTRFGYIWDAYRSGKRIIQSMNDEERKALVISCQDPFESGLVGFWLSRFSGAPLQLQVHTDFLSPYFSNEGFLNTIRVLLAKFLLKRARGVRAVSGRIRDSLVKELGIPLSRITVLPILVDTESIRQKSSDISEREKLFGNKNPVLLMASRLTKEKNIAMAIGAMCRVVPKFPNSLLCILGEGPERIKLESLARQYGIDRNVRFMGWQENLVAYYRVADVFLITSNYEGYGRTAVEALAAGCPVAMTDVGIAGEIVKDGKNGLIVPVGDEKLLAEKVIAALENQPYFRELRLGAGSTEFRDADFHSYLQKYRTMFESCVRI